MADVLGLAVVLTTVVWLHVYAVRRERAAERRLAAERARIPGGSR